MDIQNSSIVTNKDIEILDGEVTEMVTDLAETYYFDIEQMAHLELLIAKAMKLGELYEHQKLQAAKKWIDYAIQSPKQNGRYQIFIRGEQLVADWEAPYGFSDPIDGCALIQEFITHWAELPQPPVVEE